MYGPSLGQVPIIRETWLGQAPNVDVKASIPPGFVGTPAPGLTGRGVQKGDYVDVKGPGYELLFLVLQTDPTVRMQIVAVNLPPNSSMASINEITLTEEEKSKPVASPGADVTIYRQKAGTGTPATAPTPAASTGKIILTVGGIGLAALVATEVLGVTNILGMRK